MMGRTGTLHLPLVPKWGSQILYKTWCSSYVRQFGRNIAKLFMQPAFSSAVQRGFWREVGEHLFETVFLIRLCKPLECIRSSECLFRLFQMQQGLNVTSVGGGSDWVLDSLLGGKSKQGVFTADFLDENGTTVTVRDGDSTLLNCNVYLRHNKTVNHIPGVLRAVQTDPFPFLIHEARILNCFIMLSLLMKWFH